MGLPFLLKTTYLLPLMVAALSIAVIGLGFRAKQRRGYRPLMVGVFAAALLLVGKFSFESDGMLYGGGGLLMVASIWNSWPRRPAADLVELQLPAD